MLLELVVGSVSSSFLIASALKWLLQDLASDFLILLNFQTWKNEPEIHHNKQPVGNWQIELRITTMERENSIAIFI